MGVLVDAGLAEWLQVFSTAPYDFGDAMITSRGRHEHQRAVAAANPPRPQVTDSEEAPRSAWDALRLIWPKRRAYQIALATSSVAAAAMFALWSSFPDSTKEELLGKVRFVISPPSQRASDAAFLAGDFTIDLRDPYNRPTLTKMMCK
jgi:hypothetical protein